MTFRSRYEAPVPVEVAEVKPEAEFIPLDAPVDPEPEQRTEYLYRCSAENCEYDEWSLDAPGDGPYFHYLGEKVEDSIFTKEVQHELVHSYPRVTRGYRPKR